MLHGCIRTYVIIILYIHIIYIYIYIYEQYTKFLYRINVILLLAFLYCLFIHRPIFYMQYICMKSGNVLYAYYPVIFNSLLHSTCLILPFSEMQKKSFGSNDFKICSKKIWAIPCVNWNHPLDDRLF